MSARILSSDVDSPSRLPLEVLHHSPSGRIRVRSQFFYRRQEAKAAIEEAILSIQSVESVSGNPLTGSILIQFNPLLSRLDLLLADLNQVITTVKWASSGSAPLIKGSSRLSASAPSLEALLQRTSDIIPSILKPNALKSRTANRGIQSRELSRPLVDWHTLSVETALQRLSSSLEGLTCDEVDVRLEIYGRNLLVSKTTGKGFALFINQFKSIPVGMLGVSATISLATGGVADASIILCVVLVNALIGYFTEKSAEKTINALGDMRPDVVHVIRDGFQALVPFDQVVPGDLLHLSPGCYIPSDARLIKTNYLTVDESALTGESHPILKSHEAVCLVDVPIGDRTNMVYMGTTVTGGNALALVTASGQCTELGQIQALVNDVVPPETPLQRQLDQMGRTLALSSAGICGLVFLVGILRGMPWLHMLNSAISLAVAAVPEGLPTVATTTLALGIREMKRRKVLIRHLPAVESLGSIQTLCLDKTGTLTMNIMRVVAIKIEGQDIRLHDGHYADAYGDLASPVHHVTTRLLEVVSLCSDVTLSVDGMPEQGSPTESALVHASLALGVDVLELRDRYPLLRMEHRAEGRPYAVSIHRMKGSENLVAIKGSPSHVLDLCTEWESPKGRKRLTKAERRKIIAANDELAGDALRLLGVAHGVTNATDDAPLPESLVWLGLIGMEDILRPDIPALIQQFHGAGIETVMVTGDQSATALSVGRRLGLSGDESIEIVDATQLENMESDLFAEIVQDTDIFARVSPAHKLRIVQALQRDGRIIAMTGDGINDGPALKASDIGVAMGQGGTDVARAVADVVLQDDNLHTMIVAVEQGRTIYSNIRKSLRFLLATNLSEIQVMLFTTALGFREALTPMQLLWINLVTDVFPALALAVEPPEHDVLKQPPRSPEEKIISRQDGMTLLKESLMITTGAMMVFWISHRRYGVGVQTSTNTFMALTISQILQAIGNRSEKTTVLDVNRPGNPWMTAATAATLGLQTLAIISRPLRTLLQLGTPGARDFVLIIAGAAIPFGLKEGSKTR